MRFSVLEIYIIMYCITNYKFYFMDHGFYATHQGDRHGTIEYNKETKKLIFTNNPF